MTPDELADDSAIYDHIYLNAQQQDTGTYQDMAPFILGINPADLTAYQVNDLLKDESKSYLSN